MTTAQQFWNTARGRLGNRTAVIVAMTIGVAVGATGLVAAQGGPSPDDGVSPSLIAAPDTTTSVTVTTVTVSTVAVSTVADDTVTTTIAATQPTTPTSVTAVIIDVPVPTPETTIGGSGGSSDPDTTSVSTTITTAGDSTSSSAPGTTTAGTTATAITTTDDTTSSTAPGTTTAGTTATTVGGSVPSTSTAPSLPAPFTQTYSGDGGSITVSWSGTSFTLVAVSPAGSFQADIEDNDWDRIRVDFENDHDDHRIEVRLNDGEIRVRNR